MVPPWVGAGPPDLALPDVVVLQRARRASPDAVGNGGRGAEGGAEDRRPRALGGRLSSQAEVQAGGRRRAGMRCC